ncbi:hypothetical protein STEG23_002595, partial [Scotinomys teguina]
TLLSVQTVWMSVLMLVASPIPGQSSAHSLTLSDWPMIVPASCAAPHQRTGSADWGTCLSVG